MEVNLVVKRFKSTEKCTPGQLFVNDQLFGFTLEDVDRGLDQDMSLGTIQALKRYSITAIPTGTYNVILSYSPHFNRELPLVEGVKGFEGIRIHPGNTAEDSNGCILLGEKYENDRLFVSRPVCARLQELLKSAEKVTLQIIREKT